MVIGVFDIETVTQYPSLDVAPQDVIDAWVYTCQSKYKSEYYDIPEGESAGILYEKYAGLHPEFSKIVVISMITSTKGVMKSFVAANTPEGEKEMLVEFNNYLNAENVFYLVGQSILFFDIPCVVTRCLANKIKPHRRFLLNGVKPWESWVIDTHTAYKGTNYGTTNAGSLIAICLVLGIPSPKQDISGKDVSRVYWQDPEGNTPRIVTYCEADTGSTAKVFKILKENDMVSLN